MKEFAVTITLPAFADMLVEAETKDAAIAQIKENLKKGLEVEFDLEFGNPEDMDFFAYPLSGKNEESPRPELKNFRISRLSDFPKRNSSAESKATNLRQRRSRHPDTATGTRCSESSSERRSISLYSACLLLSWYLPTFTPCSPITTASRAS